MTRALRGFLMSAVRDLTVLIAACLAFRPTLRAVSESDERDLSDGDRPRLRGAMMEVENGEIFRFMLDIFLCMYLLYYTVLESHISSWRCN